MSTWATGIEIFDSASGDLICEIDKGDGEYDYALMAFVYFLNGRNNSSTKIPAKLQQLKLSEHPELFERIKYVNSTTRISDDYVCYRKSDIDAFNLNESFDCVVKNHLTGEMDKHTQTYRSYLNCERVEVMLEDIKKSKGDVVVFWYSP